MVSLLREQGGEQGGHGIPKTDHHCRTWEGGWGGLVVGHTEREKTHSDIFIINNENNLNKTITFSKLLSTETNATKAKKQ